MELLAKCRKVQLCPCYKKCQKFQKLVELRDYGLVIYCHRRSTENIRQNEAVDSAENTSDDVFIIHIKKDVKLTTSQLTSKLEKENISCPRCRKKIKHAQELMKEVKSLDRRNVVGVCDHCRKRALGSENPFCVCEEIVKLFKTVKGEKREGTKKYVYSDLQINRNIKPPAVGHKPDVEQMFYPDIHFQSDDTEMSETDSIEAVKPMVTSIVHTPHAGEKINTTNSGISLVGSDTSFEELFGGVKKLPRPSNKDRKQEEILEDIPSMNTKDELKRRHDLSLRRIVKLENDSGVLISISKRPWEQKQSAPIYHGSETEIKKIQTKHELSSSSLKSIVKKPGQRVKKSKSEPVASVGSAVKPQFRIIFPKVKEKQVTQISVKSSAELIKDSYDKNTKRKEQKRQQGQKKQRDKDEAEDKSNLEGEGKVSSNTIPLLQLSEELGILQTSGYATASGKNKLKEENQMKEKVASANAGKFNKKKLKSSDDIKRSTSDEDELNKEDKMKKGEKINESPKDLKEAEEFKRLQAEHLKSKLIEKKLLVASANKKLLTEKDKLKEEKQMKEKVASANAGKFNKKKLKSSDGIKRSTSDEDELNKEDKMKKGEKINESPKDLKEAQEFKRLQAEHLKSKLIEKKLLDKPRVEQNPKQGANSEINTKKVRMMRSHRDDELLKLVKIKQTAKKIAPSDITKELLNAHTGHRNRGKKLATCPICLNSELELDVLSINYERHLKKDKIKNIIVGEKIYKYKPSFEKTEKPEGVVPIIFEKDVFLESDLQEKVQIIPQEAVQKTKLANDVLKMDEVDTEANPGIIRYALSDRTFIDKGWTVLPTEKVLRMMNVYRMRPARPEFDWFKHNKNKGPMTYNTGERLAEIDDNGRGRWYYRSGRLALDYYDAEETNAQQRFVIYSSGERDERGRTHPITILATFDYLGNGIVFDHAGKIRLKYNQTEGVVLDRSLGPVSHWKWHTLNDPPVLQQVMIDTQVTHKDPDILNLGSAEQEQTRPDNEEMLAIEFDNFIKEKSKKLSQKFKPFQIKMKALKINEHFSLKVLDQATVYLIFRDGLTNLKINMGMILDDKEIVDTNAAEMGEVSNSLERFPARTDSLAGLQRSVAHAQRYERQHAERERRLRPPEPCASADLIFAAASKPMRLPFRTVATGSASTTRYCSRKPSNNLYYDTRLIC